MSNLNAEQQAKLKEYYDEYLAIGLNTEPCDRIKAENALRNTYVYAHDVLNENHKSKTPKFVWADSPKAGLMIAAQIEAGQGNDITDEIIKKVRGQVSYGSFECYWVAFYAFISEVMEKNPQEIIELGKDVVKNCGFYWIFNDVCVVCERPTKIIVQEIEGKGLVPHSNTEMAVQYKDGTGLFYEEGQVIPTKMSKLFNDKFGTSISQGAK